MHSCGSCDMGLERATSMSKYNADDIIGVAWATYDSNYSVSNLGDVYSKCSNTLIRPVYLSNGYATINLYGGTGYIHRMVAEAFFGIPNDLVVNHLDGKKDNPSLDNLQICTSGENQKHAYLTGLREACKGARHGLSKLNEEMVISIKLMIKEGRSLQDIAVIAGVSKSAISHISRGANWKHIHV